MSLSLQRKVFLALAAAMLLLSGIALASYRTLSTMDESARWVRHTQDVLAELADVQQTVTQAETAARGFLLTGAPAFIAPYDSALRRAESELPHLRRLVADNAMQARRARQLDRIVHRRLDILRDNVALYEKGDWPGAIAAVRTGAGRAAMDTVQAQVKAMDASERQLLADRRAAQARAVRFAYIVILSGIGLALVVSISALVAVAQDVRARERITGELGDALAKAQSANRAKSDFLARMSHELRTPLNSVIGFANVLLKNKRDTLDEQDKSFVERIQANGRHLLGIINDILDLAKIEAGRMDFSPGSVDIGVLVTETMREFDWRDGLTGELIVPAQLTPVQTDRDKLRQVLVNLISNAAKFTERGRVVVRVIADAETNAPLRIDVIDSGIGIAKERVDAIFEAFEQAEVTTARRYGGTGLGLAISRSICERLGHRLSVVSTHGEGATFSVALRSGVPAPMRHELPARGTPVVPADSGVRRMLGTVAETARPTVLVIDDSSDSRLLISQFVEDAGYQAMTATSGEQGLQMALEFRPDLITLDLMMPGMDGWDVLRRLKMHPSTADIPVVVVSIVGSEQRGGIVGAMDIVDKPVSREELIGALRRNLGKRPARVLVVEDDADARTLIHAHLSELPGFEVRTTSDAESALGVLEDFTPDLVLLDLMLPRMGGMELLARLRGDERFVDLPVVVTTSKSLDPAELRALERQTLTVVQKGATLGEQLRRVLRGVLREVRAREMV